MVSAMSALNGPSSEQKGVWVEVLEWMATVFEKNMDMGYWPNTPWQWLLLEYTDILIC